MKEHTKTGHSKNKHNYKIKKNIAATNEYRYFALVTPTSIHIHEHSILLRTHLCHDKIRRLELIYKKNTHFFISAAKINVALMII